MTSYSLMIVPITVSLWSHFPKDSGKVTGISLFSCIIMGLIFSILAMYLINPDNKQGTIDYSEGS